ncbi:MAG: DUF1318 domain-containing protein [Deltaproteobacteria bacterium]|nr:DUF1318 domain-containing protein [Deltaproteobacteria bacterium]
MKLYFKSPVLLLAAAACLFCSCASMDLYFKTRQIKPLAQEIVTEVTRGGETSEGLESSSIPGVDALKQGMKERYVRFMPSYESGILTEGDNGYLRVEDVRRMGMMERRKFAKQVHVENDARKELYKLIAQHVGLRSSYEEEVAGEFAEQWQAVGK